MTQQWKETPKAHNNIDKSQKLILREEKKKKKKQLHEAK